MPQHDIVIAWAILRDGPAFYQRRAQLSETPARPRDIAVEIHRNSLT
jgi:hypothetical protein